MRHSKQALFAVPFLAFLVAGLTGDSVSLCEGGLPLQWKFLGPACLALGCPPCTSYYDWTLFGLDVLFYSVVGYVLLFGYVRFRGGRLAG